MKSILKKTLAGVLASSMMIGFAGCGSSSSSSESSSSKSDEKVTLNVWHQWATDTNDLKKVYDAAVVKYEADHPNIKIKTDTLDTAAYKTKINTSFASSTDAVDVFYYWSPGMVGKLVQAGKVLPLDDYLKDGTLDKIVPGSIDAFKFDGKTYALPSFSWAMSLYCNKELFDKNGIKIPTNYTEWLDACKKFTAKGILPIANGTKDAWNACFVYEAVALKDVGAKNINSFLSGKAKFDDPGYLDAAKKVKELNDAGAFGKTTLSTTSDEADAAFVSGKAAMRIMGSWFAGSVYANKDSVVKDKVVAVNIPTIDGAKGSDKEFAGGFTEAFFVNNNTKHKAEAVAFDKYINEAMGNGADAISSGFTGWKGTIDTSKQNVLYKQVKDTIKDATASVLAWDTSLDGEKAQVHYDDVQALFGNKATPEQFVKTQADATK
jgi:raffinose/stachyose/melibiose transport system substrate-binding protein